MKSELYSPMKPDLSKKGLSEIMEESYKQELENSKYELAKLSNEQFLSQYLQLNNNRSIMNEFKYLLQTPICELYKKFDYNEMPKQEIFRKQIQKSIQNGVRRTINVLTKEQLKALATKKLEQSVEKQKLSSSRKQKRENFYEGLRTSRKKQEIKEQININAGKNIQQINPSTFQSPKKHITTEQSIEDLFLRLEVVGDTRDRIKKKWYGWGQKGKIQEKKAIVQQWSSNHQLMKALLQQLLEKLNRQIGTVEVFNQLKIGNQSSILQGLSSRSNGKTEKDKSLGSTRIQRNLKSQQIKLIYRFGSWFNKLLLDQRQIEYIQNLKRL